MTFFFVKEEVSLFAGKVEAKAQFTLYLNYSI